MSKKRLIALALIAVFCLAGCQNSDLSEIPTETDPEITQQPTQGTINNDITPIHENMYNISLPITEEKSYSDDGTEIFTYSYQTIMPVLQDQDVADKLIMDFTNRIEQQRANANEVLANAKALYSNATEFVSVSYEIQYDVMRFDQGVLSLYGYILNTGDAAGSNQSRICANYDLVTGDILTIGSILYHIDKKDDMAQLVINHLEEREDIRLFDEYRDTVLARFQRDESIDEDFYFSANGLCFYFEPYEIAARAYGTVTVEIPYNELTGIIGDGFFPPERIYSSGNLSVIPFADAELENYGEFVEYVAKPESTKLLLTTDTVVQDIRVYELVWSDYNQIKKNVCAVNSLSSENAIVLEAQFSVSRPNYMLCYSINGKPQQFYLARNSSGQVELLSEYIPN